MSKIFLNGSSSLNYFIHGQDLSVEFEFPNAWLIWIQYNEIPVSNKFRTRPFWFWQRLFWFKNQGVFKAHLNSHHPYLRLTIWSPLPRQLHIPLVVNRFETNLKVAKWPTLPLNNLKQTSMVSVNWQIPLPNSITIVSPKIELKISKSNQEELSKDYTQYKMTHPLFIKN